MTEPETKAAEAPEKNERQGDRPMERPPVYSIERIETKPSKAGLLIAVQSGPAWFRALMTLDEAIRFSAGVVKDVQDVQELQHQGDAPESEQPA